MKKVLAVVMALVFALTMTVAFAEQPVTKPAEPAKGAVKSIKGEVTARLVKNFVSHYKTSN